MGIIVGCIWYLFTAGITVASLAIVTVFFAFIISTAFNMPFYGPYEAFGDVQFIMMALLIHDRFIGPYSKLLRGVAKYLPGREAVTESYEYDSQS